MVARNRMLEAMIEDYLDWVDIKFDNHPADCEGDHICDGCGEDVDLTQKNVPLFGGFRVPPVSHPKYSKEGTVGLPIAVLTCSVDCRDAIDNPEISGWRKPVAREILTVMLMDAIKENRSSEAASMSLYMLQNQDTLEGYETPESLKSRAAKDEMAKEIPEDEKNSILKEIRDTIGAGIPGFNDLADPRRSALESGDDDGRPYPGMYL